MLMLSVVGGTYVCAVSGLMSKEDEERRIFVTFSHLYTIYRVVLI